jgi:pimeloyl-ACP methyl ester carboxylesterase
MYVQLESQIIYYDKVGEGQPILLLHGNGEDHEIFKELMEALQDRFTCYAMDTRGHGASATPSEYHYDQMAEDVYHLIRFLELEKPLVLGFSDGAILAMLTEIHHPGTIGRLILCGGNTTPKGMEGYAYHEMKKRYKKMGNPLDLLMVTEPNITKAELRTIACPTLVIAGEKDIIRKKETKHIATEIPNATMEILPGENHFSYLINSDKLKERIFAFTS